MSSGLTAVVEPAGTVIESDEGNRAVATIST